MRSLNDPVTMLAGVGAKGRIVLLVWESKPSKTY